MAPSSTSPACFVHHVPVADCFRAHYPEAFRDPVVCPCCGEQLLEDDGIYCQRCSPEVHDCTPRDFEPGEEPA